MNIIRLYSCRFIEDYIIFGKENIRKEREVESQNKRKGSGGQRAHYDLIYSDVKLLYFEFYQFAVLIIPF